MGNHVRRHARAVVADAELERQRHLVPAARNRKAEAGLEGGGQHDLAVRRVADRFGGVLHEIEEDLDELVAIGEDRRQRGIVFVADLDRAGEAGLGEPADMVEDDVDVDRLALDRPLVGEDFHAVDELHDAVGLVADQAGQRPVVVVDRGLEELRRAADAGKRVLDLMGEHRGKAGDRAGGAAMRELAVDLVGHRPLLEQDDHAAVPLEGRRRIDVDDALAAVSRRADVDPVFVDRRVALAHLIDQRQKRAAERNEIGERMTPEHVGRRLEERLGRRVRLDDARSPIVDQEHGMRQRVEKRARGVVA